MDILIYIAAFIFVIALIVLGAWLWRNMLSEGTGFGSSKDKRIGFIEAASIDGRRKLVLVRRDNVEHLIMTGGPVDVVVETGIEPPQHVHVPPHRRSAEDPFHMPQPQHHAPSHKAQVDVGERIFGARGPEGRQVPEMHDQDR